MRNFVIAIDGPAGAGKSTVAKRVANQLGFIYIDTGAMYRSIAWKALQSVTAIEEIAPVELGEIANQSTLSVSLDSEGSNHFYVDSIEVTEAIRSPQVSRAVAVVAANPEVRAALAKHQQKMGESQSIVMDGRDIGTTVFPTANLKVFLTASVEMRAERRWKELEGKGEKVDYQELKNEIALRDKMDQEREVSPLIAAEDAIFVDTTSLSIDQVVGKIIELYEERVK